MFLTLKIFPYKRESVVVIKSDGEDSHHIKGNFVDASTIKVLTGISVLNTMVIILKKTNVPLADYSCLRK